MVSGGQTAKKDPNDPFAAFLAARPAGPTVSPNLAKGYFCGFNTGARTELDGLHDGPAYGRDTALDPFSTFLAARPRHPTKELDSMRFEVARIKKELMQVSLDAEFKARNGELPEETAARVLRLQVAQRYLEQPHRICEVFSGGISVATSEDGRRLSSATSTAGLVAEGQPVATLLLPPADNSRSLPNLHAGSSRPPSATASARSAGEISLKTSGTLRSTGSLAVAAAGSLHLREPLLDAWFSKTRSFNVQMTDGNLVCRRTGTVAVGGCFVFGNGRMPYFRGSHLLHHGYYYAFKVESFDAAADIPGVALAVGISSVKPRDECLLGSRRPLYAYEVPGAIVAGFGANYIAEGKWFRSPWDSSALRVGDKVGVMLSSEGGEFVVFVNDVQVLRTPTSLLTSSNETALGKHCFYPLVDLCGGISGLRLLPLAELPNVPLKHCGQLERKLTK